MKKLCATTFLMVSLGLLTACQDNSNDKMEPEPTQQSIPEVMDNAGEALSDTADAIEQQVDETLNPEPTMGERIGEQIDEAGDRLEDGLNTANDAIEENLDAAGDRIGEAYEGSKDYLQEKGEQARDAAAEARDNLEQRMKDE